MILHIGKRQNPFHTGWKCGNHRDIFLFHKAFLHHHPLHADLVALDIRIIKHQVTSRINQYILIKEPIIFVDFSGTQIAVGQNQFLAIIFPDAVYKM